MKNIFALFLILASSGLQEFSAQLTITDPDHYSIWPVNQEKPIRSVKLSTGVSLQFVEQGDANGIPVIFLHGLTDSWRSFESVFGYLPSHIHAYAISQRGHGDSQKPIDNYAMKDFADDVAAFINELGLQQVILVGHSMGGMVAQQFALEYPSLLKGLVLVDTDASFQSNPGMLDFLDAVMKLKDPINYEFADEFQKSTLAKPIDAEYYTILVSEGLKVPAHVWKSALREMMSTDLTSQLPKIQAPVLILWGEKDAICMVEDQQMLARQIRNSKLIVYQNTGHALHWEEPERFASDLSEFVKRVYVFNNR